MSDIYDLADPTDHRIEIEAWIVTGRKKDSKGRLRPSRKQLRLPNGKAVKLAIDPADESWAEAIHAGIITGLRDAKKRMKGGEPTPARVSPPTPAPSPASPPPSQPSGDGHVAPPPSRRSGLPPAGEKPGVVGKKKGTKRGAAIP